MGHSLHLMGEPRPPDGSIHRLLVPGRDRNVAFRGGLYRTPATRLELVTTWRSTEIRWQAHTFFKAYALDRRHTGLGGMGVLSAASVTVDCETKASSVSELAKGGRSPSFELHWSSDCWMGGSPEGFTGACAGMPASGLKDCRVCAGAVSKSCAPSMSPSTQLLTSCRSAKGSSPSAVSSPDGAPRSSRAASDVGASSELLAGPVSDAGSRAPSEARKSSQPSLSRSMSRGLLKLEVINDSSSRQHWVRTQC